MRFIPTNPVVIKRCLGLFLLSVIGVVVFYGINDSEQVSAVRRGDFPAFWSMAVIASSAEPSRLYDLKTQRQVQNTFWPSLNGALLPAAYPAHLAFVLAPLARLDCRVARGVWSIGSVLIAFGGLSMALRLNPRITWAPWMIFSLLLVFTPTLRGFLGGQVLPLISALFALLLTLERRGGSKPVDLALGAIIGVLLFKPYYAIAALMVPVLQRRWWTLLSFSFLAGLSWYLGSLVLGPSWLSEWSAFASYFAKGNLETNAHQMPNIWAQIESLCIGCVSLARFKWALIFLAYLIFTLMFGALLGASTVHSLIRDPRRYGGYLYILFLSLVVLLMPQVNFYDLGVLVSPIIVLFRPEEKLDRYLVTACFIAALFAIEPPLGIPVHFIVGLLALGYIATSVRRELAG